MQRLGHSSCWIVIQKVRVSDNVNLSDLKVYMTPQSCMDSAVYQLSQQRGSLASESLWLGGSLAMTNFCLAHGFDPKSHSSKRRVVGFLKESFEEFSRPLNDSWNNLDMCHQNAYEDVLSLKEVREYLKSTEVFCNTLFDIHHHQTKKFDLAKFKQYLPKAVIVNSQEFEFR